MGFLISTLISTKADLRGNKVEEIYAVASETFAVYRASGRVSVAFADDFDLALRQRDNFAPLEALRGEILGLMEGWTDPGVSLSRKRRAESYNRRLADGLVLAFREQTAAAKTTLESVKADLLRERTALGRRVYLLTAVAAVVPVLGLGASVASVWTTSAGTPDPWVFYWVLSSGCFGALFSIVLGLQGRRIQPDLLNGENILDACLRIAVGSMSALILYALIRADMIGLEIAGQSLDHTQPWGFPIFLAGVLAGFSERLVGDILAQGGVAGRAPPTIVAGAGQAADAVQKALIQANAAGPAGGPVPPKPEEDPDEALGGDPVVSSVSDEDLTSDVELPPARGGVQT